MKKLLLILAIVIVLILIGKKATSDSAVVNSCTEEALICPNGESVSRTGNQCYFAACEYNGPYDGLLANDKSGELVLILQNNYAKDYIIPLKTLTSNSIKDFIGHNVTVSGRFESGNSLIVDNIKFASESEIEKIMMHVGETINIYNLHINFVEILGDYRCAVDEECLEKGGYSAKFLIDDGDETDELYISSDSIGETYKGFKIQLGQLSPLKTIERSIFGDEYKLELIIEKLSA